MGHEPSAAKPWRPTTQRLLPAANAGINPNAHAATTGTAGTATAAGTAAAASNIQCALTGE